MAASQVLEASGSKYSAPDQGKRKIPSSVLASGVVLACALLPLLYLHGRELWGRDHYRFFPWLIPGAVVLAYVRLYQPGPVRSVISRRTCVLFFAMAWLALAAGIVLLSGWLGAVAAQFTLLACAYGLGGRALVGRLMPAWLLLWLAVPLPDQLDAKLVASLQRAITICASRTLDVLGVMHARDGNVLEVAGRRVLVEEACSGIHSLFSVLACTLFWACWQRRPLAHSIALLGSAAIWVLAGNVFRVVLSAWIGNVGGLDLGKGWGHEALGFAIFGLILLLVWSTDHLLMLLREIYLLPWARPRPVAADTPQDLPSPRQGANLSRVLYAPRAWPVAIAFGILVLAWPMLACYAVAERSRTSSAREAGATQAPGQLFQALDALGEKSLPKQWGGWELAGFEKAPGKPGDRFGSRSWLYRRAEQTIKISLDEQSFGSWHELTTCYESQGWIVESRHTEWSGPGSMARVVAAKLHKPLDDAFGYLVFQIRDETGRPRIPPPDTFWARLRERFVRAWPWHGLPDGDAVGPGETPIGFQVQLLLESAVPLTAGEEARAQQAFERFLNALPRSNSAMTTKRTETGERSRMGDS